MKIVILPLVLILVIQSAALRRTPKVYNALITTDQNLTPSKAYPVIQPHLQETYALPSYSYRSYAPLGFYNSGFHYGSAAASSIAHYNGFHNYPRLSPGPVEGHFLPRDEIHTTLPPIPLNGLGLSPSLLPINSFELGNLAPYPYSSYPLIHDQFASYGGYLPNLLPPYPFYPPELDGENIAGKGKKDGTSKDEDNKSPDPMNGNNAGSDGGSSGSSANGSSDGGGGASSGGGNSASGGSSGGGNGSSGGSSGSSGGSSSSSSVSTSTSTRSSI